MADAGIVPQASSRELIHPIRADQNDWDVSRQRTLEFTGLRRVVDTDLARVFARTDSLDDIIASGPGAFARYEGDRSRLLDALERRKRIDFLALCYMGKIPNHLQAGSITFDLAEITFLARLNRFCEVLESAVDKPVSFTVAVEDAFFDQHIFRYEASRGPMTLRRVREELSRFDLSHVRADDLSDYLASDFVPVFEECIGTTDVAADEDMSARFQRTFELAYPTRSFAEAVAQYSDPNGRREIARWAELSTERYVAFFEARNRTEFWRRNGGFMRATDSERASVVQVNFGIGRVSVPHGVAVLEGDGGIGCDYYYDLVAARAQSGEGAMRLVEADGGTHVAFE